MSRPILNILTPTRERLPQNVAPHLPRESTKAAYCESGDSFRFVPGKMPITEADPVLSGRNEHRPFSRKAGLCVLVRALQPLHVILILSNVRSSPLKRGILLLTLVSLSVVALSSGRVLGHEVTLAGWKTNHQEAWRSAQTEHRPMLLYISSENCVYCRKMVHDTLTDKSVAARIQEGFVPVNVVAKDNRMLVRKLRVKSYPTTVIISPRSVILDYIPGYVSADELKMRLAAAVSRLADNRR